MRPKSLFRMKKRILHGVQRAAMNLTGSPMSKIAFVTEELAVYGRSGGIGAAIFELAMLLRDAGHDVDIHYIPIDRPTDERQEFIVSAFRDRGIKLRFIEPSKYCWSEGEAQKRAYAVFAHLCDCGKEYDFLHVHDYKGLGFFCCAAKQQGIAFLSTTIVVQLHGPTRWTTHANRGLFTHRDQLVIDFLERESIARADHVVSPSAYLVEWLKKNEFVLPEETKIHVIKNIYSHCVKILGGRGRSSDTKTQINELVLFGRHETRKGFVTFCDTLDILAEQLEEQGISVCFIGGVGEIDGQPSGIYLSERSKNWNFQFELRVGFDRMDAINFLRSRKGALVVIPSTEENSPYTVVEALAAGRPVVTSAVGGAKELIAAEFHDEAVVEIDPETLAERLSALISNGASTASFMEPFETVESRWLAFHETCRTTARAVVSDANPKVVVGITHFERPRKVIGAIMSVMRQTYDNIELVVIDDGSRSAATLEALPLIEKLVERAGGRLIRQQNGYLGAARNAIAKATQSEFLLFLDDDDLLLPDAVERLVAVGVRTGADVVNCLNVYLDVSHRSEYELSPEFYKAKVSYVPIGGPLSLAHLGNYFGAATALIKRSFFDHLGGYTEIKRVGYEDYEFYVRALQQSAKIEIVPLPLYLYEVGKPSMVSGTSRVANKRRIFDALDIDQNSNAWRDAVELGAGVECLNDQQNFLNWRTSISPHRELIQRVIETRGQISEHVLALAEYAQAIGASRIAAAWKLALQPSERNNDICQQQKPLRGTKPTRQAQNSNQGEVELATELAGLLKLGRVQEAIDATTESIKRTNEISETIVEFAFLIASVDGLRSESIQSLIDHLSDAFIDESLSMRLRGAIASLAISGGMFDFAKTEIAEIDRTESRAYIDKYPDLQAAFGTDALERALRHYHQHGEAEGREGFPILRRLSYDIGQRLNKEVKPWQVRNDLHRVLRPAKTPLSLAALVRP